MHPDPIVTELLEQIVDYPFSEPVTAYLTDVIIQGNIGLGFTFRHVRADWKTGRFTDGRLIHTSTILQVDREGPFWILRTFSGSFYVIVSFNVLGGARSLAVYQKRVLLRGSSLPSQQLH